MSKIYPLILCGGNGSRLWPMSRIRAPKQFQSINGPGSRTLFQDTVQRHRGADFHDPIVVTSVAHMRLVSQQLAALQCRPSLMIGEPAGRNTGPAVLAAALAILASDPDALLMVLPADHAITGDLATPAALSADAAARGQIITFGITPTAPETGFGYIMDGGRHGKEDNLRNVECFVEKPDSDKAQALLSTGKAYWASGISLFAAQTILRQYRRFDPKTASTVKQAVDLADRNDLGLVLDRPTFSEAIARPTESAIFEKSPDMALMPLDVAWNDVGSWSAIHEVGHKTPERNVIHGDVMAIDVTDSLIRANDRLVTVVGLSNVIVVDTADAVLVTSTDTCQDVKTLVEEMRSEDRPELIDHATRQHEWGESRQLSRSATFDVSLMRVRSGHSLELDALPGTHLTNASGLFHVTSAGGWQVFRAGEQLNGDGSGKLRLKNAGEDTGEIIVLRHFSDTDTPVHKRPSAVA